MMQAGVTKPVCMLQLLLDFFFMMMMIRCRFALLCTQKCQNKFKFLSLLIKS